MQVKFENHLSLRVMEIFFQEPHIFKTTQDVQQFKKLWMSNLKSWHSPYTLVLDCRGLLVEVSVQKDFLKLFEFFSKFFMRKIVGFVVSPEEIETFKKQFTFLENESPAPFPFEIFPSYEAACAQTGLGREGGMKRDLGELRSRIQIDNDFNAHVMEISFLAETHLNNPEDIKTLKQKIQNILMQWHSPYSVMFKCDNLTFSEEARLGFSSIEKFLKSFFCKNIIGYSPKQNKNVYPFQTFRSRHLAAAELEHQGLQSGEVANCSTRKNFSL
jgi:hypothetical protein